MGDQNINPISGHAKSEFVHHLLGDIEALEHMLANGLIEKGVTRIGAEQEFCLVSENLRPAMTGPAILSQLGQPHFTSELARWNLEVNLDPQDAGAGCLSRMHHQLDQSLKLANEHAQRLDSHVLLTGILPTIRKSELDFKYMTPNARYQVLDQILKDLRGEDFSMYVEGVDEINLKHSSILFEACNTSFQVHLQIDPDQFADRYNWSQVLAGPVLAVSVNSPTLLGKELWSETRIALFRQSIEVRQSGQHVRDQEPRVAFGNHWLESSASEVFKDDVAFYQLIVASELGEEHAMDVLAESKIPNLRAMNLHNGTVYKWNRACYGVGNGKPHLRIENRYLPSGPTTLDEMANASFWIGSMQAMPDKCRADWDRHFYYQEVRSNFLKSAQHGLSNELRWFGKSMDAVDLIVDHLLPLAETGLRQLGIPQQEFAPYLRIIERRAATRRTGASWVIDSLRSLRSRNTVDESILMITRHMRDNCLESRPVHEWKIPGQSTLVLIPDRYERVDSVMVTNVVTVRDDDLLEFAEALMRWKDFHHLPVENASGKVIGILSANDIDRHRSTGADQRNALVRSIMTTDTISIAPETRLELAEQMMLDKEVGSLPVVSDQRVIGLITAHDVREVRRKLDTE